MRLLPAFEAARRVIANAAGRLIADDADDFTCGQCDRNARCGLPPRADCLHRLTLLAEGRASPAHPAHWPMSFPGSGERAPAAQSGRPLQRPAARLGVTKM